MVVKNVEKKEKNAVAVVVEVDKDEFEAAVNRSYLKNRGDIAVPGFRKGKAPRAIVEGMYGEDAFYGDAIDELCPKAIEFAVKGEELDTVGRAKVNDANVTDEKSLIISFECGLFPEVTLGQYRGLEAPRASLEVTDAEIEAELGRIRERNARIETVERPAENGDTAVIDFEGFLDGAQFQGGTGENFSLKLGSGQFIPGFEDQVIGMSAGEERDINVTFPEDYHAGMAGKSVVFHVKVNEVRESQLPELDDEFAKDVSEFDTLEEYKADIRKSREKSKSESAQQGFKNELIKKAVENMQCDIPDSMVDLHTERMIRDYSQSLSLQGYSLEQYLSGTGMSFDLFRASSQRAALREVQSNLLLNKIAEVEALEADDDEVEAEYAEMAKNYGIELDFAKNNVSAEDVRMEVKLKKAADIILETGIATEPKPIAAEDLWGGDEDLDGGGEAAE